jgi:di/tricarboxylate transporter
MFLSMWISNTATTAMMLPIVDAVAEAINTKVEEVRRQQIIVLTLILTASQL